MGPGVGAKAWMVPVSPSMAESSPLVQVVALVSISKIFENEPGVITSVLKLNPTTSPAELRSIVAGLLAGAGQLRKPKPEHPPLAPIPTSVLKPANEIAVIRPIP